MIKTGTGEAVEELEKREGATVERARADRTGGQTPDGPRRAEETPVSGWAARKKGEDGDSSGNSETGGGL